MLPQGEVSEVVEVLRTRLPLDAVWLFGSCASGTLRPDSDVDLGILLSGGTPEPDALLTARADLSERLRREVDLVDLERASPVLAYQVVKHGRLLWEADPRHRVRFVAELIGRYEDVRTFRARIEQAALERVRGRA